MWINKNTLEVYRLHSEIRFAFREKSLPQHLTNEVLLALGICQIKKTDKPKHDFTKVVYEVKPKLENDVWVQVWEVRDASQEEIESHNQLRARNLREQRDKALSASDWRVIRATETGVALDAEWAAYRQALRDLPHAEGWPNVDLPNDPDFVSSGE